jgi:hypothetical protein
LILTTGSETGKTGCELVDQELLERAPARLRVKRIIDDPALRRAAIERLFREPARLHHQGLGVLPDV